jgi:four helix bundle protein
MAFPFQKLTVYQKTLEWIDEIETLLDDSSRQITHAQKDQLSRASMSILLNLAEGNGRWHKAEKRNFFWISRGSVFECVAILEILNRRNRISETQYQHHFSKLEELGKMLTGLVKSVEGIRA